MRLGARPVRRRLSSLGVIAVALVMAPAAHAQTVSCTVSATPLAFGNYNAVTRNAIQISGTVTLSCTGPGSLSASISLGGGYNNNIRNRGMKPPAGWSLPLSYQVYLDSDATFIFGDGASGTGTISKSQVLATGTTTFNTPIYGYIPAGLSPAPGTYTDSLLLTVTY